MPKTKNPKDPFPCLQSYLKAQRVFCKPSTLVTHTSNLRHFLHYLRELFQTSSLSGSHIASLSKLHLQDYVSSLCARKISTATKLNYCRSLQRYLRWEIAQGALSEEILQPLHPSGLPRMPEYLPRPLSSENDHLLTQRLEASQNPYAPIFLLLRHTGLRIGELIALPPNPIVILRSQEKYLKVPLGKMDNERLLPLSESSVGLIAKIQSLVPLRKGHQNPHRLIGFNGCSSHVRRHLGRQFEKFHADILDQGKPITFHRLRHTYATSLLTGGLPISSLMKLLGHKKIEMTLRYTKVTPSHMREEYLKALTVLQQHAGLVACHSPRAVDPSQIFAPLIALISQASHLTPLQQKNILLRIRRLQQNLQTLCPTQITKTLPLTKSSRAD